jgi:hypothetical protein
MVYRSVPPTGELRGALQQDGRDRNQELRRHSRQLGCRNTKNPARNQHRAPRNNGIFADILEFRPPRTPKRKLLR